MKALLLLLAIVGSASADLDSQKVTCHRKYWDRKGRWTYVLCVFPDGSTDLYMRVPDHAYSDPVVTPNDTRHRLEWMSPAIIQIPGVQPLPPDPDEEEHQQ